MAKSRKSLNIMYSLLFCVVSLISYAYSGTECVVRESGACKVRILTKSFEPVPVNTFGELPPEGYQLYTAMEVHYVANKYSYIHNMVVEQTTPTYYGLDNAAAVSIIVEGHRISGNASNTNEIPYVIVDIGRKFYRQAIFEYHDFSNGLMRKYNNYTPDLPTFPYILQLEITTKNNMADNIAEDKNENFETIAVRDLSGTFSIYTKGQTEPFFQHELGEEFIVHSLGIAQIISSSGERPELAAFYDCSIKNMPNCGTHYIENLYACREIYEFGNTTYGSRNITNFARNENTIFDEYVVVNNKFQSSMTFSKYQSASRVSIAFQQDSIEIEAKVRNCNNETTVKKVRTKQWLEFPAIPYFVRVLITNGTDNSYVHLIDMRNETVLKLNLCGDFPTLTYLELHGKIYFDCIRSPSVEKHIERPRKSFDGDFAYISVIYDEIGINFTKPFFYKDKIVEQPMFSYFYNSITSEEDWCKGKPTTDIANFTNVTTPSNILTV